MTQARHMEHCVGIKGMLGFLCLLACLQTAVAVDSSGRNSHFWITLRPAGRSSKGSMELELANGYRSVKSDSPLLSCKTVGNVYEITWKGNNLIGGPEADTLQFNVEIEASGAVLKSITVNGASPKANGLELESSFSRFKPRKLNGRRPPKNYFQIHGSIVLRNRALTIEDPKHPFADLKNGHTFEPTPYEPSTAEKLKSFPAFSWDKVPRGMLIRKSTAYRDEEIAAMAKNYQLIVLEKANSAGQGNTSLGMKHTATRLKKINPKVKILFYWNSRIFFGHYGIDNTIDKHKDEWIAKDFVIRGRLPTYVRENKDFLKWWVGCCAKMIAHPAIDGTFVDKAGVPIYMLDALYKATPNTKLVMNNNSSARKRIGYVDGTYREGWSGGNDDDTIAETLAIARETGLNKKMQILRMPVHGVTSKQEMEDRIDRGLAIFLLYAEEYSYFYWQATVDAKKGKPWEWDASYVDQLNRPLGKPLGRYIRDNKVYTRSFEHCDVYMDLRPDPNSKHVTRILWKNNVGKPAKSGGGISYTNDTYKLKGCGSLANRSDQFFYLSDAHYGGGEIQARIDSLDKSSPEAKAGVMFRESLAANAKTVAVLRDPAGKMYMMYRSTPGGEMSRTAGISMGNRPYAKLVRKENAFTGYGSADGKHWTEIKTVSIQMAEKIEMGMAVASYDNNALATATFSAFSRLEPSVKLRNTEESKAPKETVPKENGSARKGGRRRKKQ